MPEETRRAHTGRVLTLLAEVDAAIRDDIGGAAALILAAVSRSGLVHVAGAGHSLAMVCETFYRVGGLAAVRPLWHPSLLPLSSGRGSTLAVRTEGLGHAAVRRAAPESPDVAVVFSTSGTHPYPVEVALACAARGVPVIAVTSPRASRHSARRTSSRLADHATVVLDTCVPRGDVTHPADSPRTAAISTLSAAYVWSQLLVEVDAQAVRTGTELPRWASATTPSGDAGNQHLLKRYGDRVPELGHP
ncbi:sugar isomerase domain-containing protein [Streptomyces lavendulocolor]|uniref:sugar isomerase domain-containing protein n=1 Tax=Streptomyces lavendulocolor TaxID=67316 RepID=UPI003C2F3EEA